MNITQAKQALLKLYGRKAAWRYNDSAPKAEERAALREQLPVLQRAMTEAKMLRDARHRELLNDPEYIRLFNAYNETNRIFDIALSRLHSYRVEVGISNGLFFEVKAQGDNWQETIDKARDMSK